MISRDPQNIDASCWYYENAGSIDLILSVARVSRITRAARKQGARFSSANAGFIHIRIPSSKLAKTLKRQGKVK